MIKKNPLFLLRLILLSLFLFILQLLLLFN